MRAIICSLKEVCGLFVDDYTFATVVFVWVGAVGIWSVYLKEQRLQGPLLVAALVMILIFSAIDSAWRSGRQKAKG